ncbi:hypothetical protein ABB26_04540 [Stenotrophomonas humi]|uniref:Transmembrane repetitive protein n=1 Tax=Stenotrophomonas humi TaxID=405444 RepID=A0A0R0CJG6_9GAMM|nr:hypothetical protein [Stenotrophomonas humi]KRG65096.1 hypothetical protein ABB26_04540 [Stenotrophomonas humi]
MPVTSVTDLIDLLAARRQASILHDRRTGMPYSWSHWVRTRVSKAMSAFADGDVAGVIAAKPERPRAPAPMPRPFLLTMLLLLWQGGDPPPRDQRVMRWIAAFFSAALHLLFALLLVWVALIRSPSPEQSAEEGERVQVEYIGRGTPDEEGGGAPQAQGQQQADASAAASASASSAAANASASASAAAAPATASVESTATAAATPAEATDDEQPLVPIDASKPSPEMPTAQPLQVTEAQQPTTDFVLPPPTLRPPTLATPSVSVPQVQVRERVVETATDRPQVTQSARALPSVQPQLKAPDVQVRERQIEVMPQQQVAMSQVRQRVADVQMTGPEMAVRERQVDAAPTQPVNMAQLRSTETNNVQLKTPTVAVRERQLPGVPDAATSSTAAAAAVAKPASATGTGAATSAQFSNVAQGNTAQGNNAAANPSPRPGTSAGAGPKPQDRSGGWDSAVRSDDWGASQRQVAGSAGGQSDKGRGLFDADGGVRLADDGAGKDSKRGAPGGDADSWTRDRIADSGTWLKRPPYDYTPTSFDKYWVPNESLLAEWVRKGIKSVEIPIPGTSNKISCVVSLLQFGGGCGLTNPNMQEQPAEARPPPDIPFKKELQEDNGSR